VPKLKTKKTVAKRFKKTASGKLTRGKAYKRHILTSKTRKRKRHLKQGTVVSDGDSKRMNRLLPYSQ
jgi:large subunit ribosomal protein L35